jgi:hypothetical protein
MKNFVFILLNVINQLIANPSNILIKMLLRSVMWNVALSEAGRGRHGRKRRRIGCRILKM